MPAYDYPVAFKAWGEEEHAAIHRVIASGDLTMGAEVAAFEAEFAVWHGMRHGIMVNSGSSANLVAVAALFHKQENPLKRGDKALVPAIAWATTYAPLVQMGLDLVLADADETWNAACPEQQRFFNVDCRLIVGCSILGNPATLESWRGYADRIGAHFIEDNCEALGAAVDGRPCGTFGVLNTFSFFWSHQLSAVEGGMILTDDDELARLCRLLRNHGNAGFMTPDAPFGESYDFRLFGYNVRPLEIHAAIARAQLPKQERFRVKRATNLATFREEARWAGLPVTLQKPGDRMNPFGLAFTCQTLAQRALFVAALRANGIDCRLPTGGSFTRHPYGAPWRDQATPVADRIHDTGLFLGNAPFDIGERIAKAVRVMKEAL